MATIFKIGKTWYVNYAVNGRRIKQRIGRDRRTAELALKEIEVKPARKQIGLVEQRVYLNDFCKEFMGYVLTNKARNTVQGYRATLDHFLRFLDKARVQHLEDVTAKHLEGFKTFRCEMNASPGTINQELKRISHFFTIAKRYRYIDSNPASEVKKLRTPDRPPRFFSQDELDTIFANADHYRVISWSFYFPSPV